MVMEWAIDRETVLTSKPVRWLLSAGKAANGVSVLGGVVAMILDKVFGGIHNVPLAKAPVAWDDAYVVHVTLSWQTLATVDDSRLTALVVLAHDNALRLQIAAKAANHIELMFHQRQRAGSLSQRCPTLEESAGRIRQLAVGGEPATKGAFAATQYPATVYELERSSDRYEPAIVARRGIFEKYDDKIFWFVDRDAHSGLLEMYPKEPNGSNGLFFREIVSRHDDLLLYLWETPQEIFAWWEANREKIIAFHADRMRWHKTITESEVEHGAE